MASLTLAAEADVSVRRDTALAAGLGDHLPVGYWSGALYRAAIRFPIPAGWQGWASLDSATLNIYVTDHHHVGVRNSQFYVRRQLISSIWTKGAGSQDCESGYSGGNNTQDSDLPLTSSGQVSTNSGSTVNLKRAVGVTGLVQYYLDNAASKIVLILDPVSTADYMEFWSREHGPYPPTLDITYTATTTPNAPTLTAPAAGAVGVSQTPHFTWVHNDPLGNDQAVSQVAIYDSTGATLLYTWDNPLGYNQFMDALASLAVGTTYQWQARTSSEFPANYGPWSAKRSFTTIGPPVVTIDATRRMVFSAKAPSGPRLVVQWTADQTATSYRVTTASGYDSGPLADGLTSHTIEKALTDNVAENVTVAVTSAIGTGSASRSFTPRFGLTTHRRDLTVAPGSWTGYVVTPTPASQPAGSTLQIEFGSDPAANAAPVSGWFTSLGAIPLNRYLFWRAWLIPSATAGPTLDKIVISSATGAAQVDKWGTTRDTPGLVAPWSIADGESVYGTRSMHAVLTDTNEHVVYAYKVTLKANRTYILTGLMKSNLNSGAHFRLEDASGVVLLGGGMLLPPNTPVKSAVLTGTLDWYDQTRRDTNRYKTPTYQAPATDIDAYVVLAVQGVVGAQAWFDAIKLEESSVATPWSPGAIGATVVDAGGVQIDGNKGGVFRYKGTDGAARSVVGGGAAGLLFAGDTELASPSTGLLTVGGSQIARISDIPAPVSSVPSGAMAMWPTAAAPTGWLLCQGQSVLRTDYPALFTAIGVAYGSVDGTHFTLPDMRQRFPLGVAAAGTGSTLAGTGGGIDHTHTVPAQDMNPSNDAPATGTNIRLRTNPHAHPATSTNNPPFLALNFIIKT
jgi:microcystin-dependent protein